MKYRNSLEEFKKMELIGGHRIQEVYEDPEIIPFLSDIDTKVKKDMEILRSWEKWFKDLDVPYVIVVRRKRKYSNRLQLWKHGVDYGPDTHCMKGR